MKNDYQIPAFLLSRPATRVVCTIGPATATVASIKSLIEAGMSVARLNLAQGTPDSNAALLSSVRQAASELKTAIGVLADLPGPKYRTGPVALAATQLGRNASFTLTSSSDNGRPDRVSVVPAGIHLDVRPGARILVEDGAVELKVERIEGEDVVCTVTGPGELRSRKGVASPGHTSTLDYFTDETSAALEWVKRHEVDFVGISYVRSAEDIVRVRADLAEAGRKPQLIAKIELQQAAEDLNSIMGATDGVMVARGDLGVEMDLELVPEVQKRIIRTANQMGKPVITATQMLDSMIHAPNPTRAEVTDVYNAVVDGTDAVMLSGETAIGQYPVRAVEYMVRIARRAEETLDREDIRRRRSFQMSMGGRSSVDDAIAQSASRTASAVGAKVIIAFTESGSTAARVSSFRPSVPIFALTRQEAAGAALSLRWGVIPTVVDAFVTVQEMFYEASKAAVQSGFARDSDLVVVVVGMPIGVPGNTNLLRVIRVPEPMPEVFRKSV